MAVAALVAAANASQGAYFSQSWGWVALAFLMPTTISLILGVAETPGGLRLAFAGLVFVLGVWIALSALWSLSPSGSIREVERMLVYVALALALAFVFRRGDARALSGGLFLACAAIGVYALERRLFPESIGSGDLGPLYRAEPLGYRNALGLLAAMGLVLGAGIVAHSRRPLAAGAAALIPALVTTLYLTFSRGAWLALGVGYAALVTVDSRRLRVLFVTLPLALVGGLAVLAVGRYDALTNEGVSRAAIVDAGRSAGIVVVFLSLAAGLVAWLARGLATRAVPGRSLRSAVEWTLCGVAIVALAAPVAMLGGPGRTVVTLRERFEAPPAGGVDSNERLFSLSGNSRRELLSVAWDSAQSQLVLGHGAGSFEILWYQKRPRDFVLRDAHSLYAEMLTEVGAVGLGLLVLALALPAVGAIRARRSCAAPAAFGAFSAWAVATAVDWHWEMVGVTCVALLAGGACLLASERKRGRALTGSRCATLAVATAALSVFAVVSLVGNQALFAARDAARQKDWVSAREHARRAETLLPWSHEPLIVRGDVEARLGNRAGALHAYRDAVSTDPENWVAWLRLAQVAQGAERAAAYAHVRALNPLEEGLPGETD